MLARNREIMHQKRRDFIISELNNGIKVSEMRNDEDLFFLVEFGMNFFKKRLVILNQPQIFPIPSRLLPSTDPQGADRFYNIILFLLVFHFYYVGLDFLKRPLRGPLLGRRHVLLLLRVPLLGRRGPLLGLCRSLLLRRHVLLLLRVPLLGRRGLLILLRVPLLGLCRSLVGQKT